MVPRGGSVPPAGPGLTLDIYLFHECLKAVFVLFFFFLNKHEMVGTNTSLGEGQGFRMEKNFHKNIKNGKKLLFKKFAIQTKWQLLKISIKKRKRICCQWYPFS